MNIGKLGRGSSLEADTYHGVKKMRHILVEKVCEALEDLVKEESDDIRVLEVDFWNHLRNVFLRGMSKSFFTLLGNTMKE